VVEHGEHIVEEIDPGSRIEDHAGLHPMIADVLDGAVQVDAGFVVDPDPIGARLGEGGNEIVGILDHEVAIERQSCDFA
jgi:hypothetical protein